MPLHSKLESYQSKGPIHPVSNPFPPWDEISLTDEQLDISEANLVTRVNSAKSLVRKLAPGWFPDSPIPDLSDTIAQLVLQQSREFLRSAAESAADGFTISQDLLQRESALLSSAGSFEAFITAKKDAVKDERFNETRCREFFSDDPEFPTLLEIAMHGATIDVAADFKCNCKPEPFRASHGSLEHTFLAHAYKFWSKSQGALLPTEVAVSLGLHFSHVHWTPKPMAPLGRFLLDLSNNTSGTPLNPSRGETNGRQTFRTCVLPHYP